MNIGLLEDDLAQANMVLQWLTDSGHHPYHADTGEAFLGQIAPKTLDLAVLDWELPDVSGYDVLRQLRSVHGAQYPIIFVTQRDSEEDIVSALRAGADDYLIKPLRQQEFLARLQALSRRLGLRSEENQIVVGPICIDTTSRQVTVDGELVKMTDKDYQLACCVLSNPGKLLNREYLLKTVWGVDADISTRTVDVHISRIRRGLRLSPAMGYCLKNIYQHGYRLEKLN